MHVIWRPFIAVPLFFLMISLLISNPTLVFAVQPGVESALESAALEAAALESGKPGYGMLFFRMVLMLGVVCALALLSLKWGLKRFMHPNSSTAAFAVIARLPIEPKRTLLVVRIASRHLILASGETGLAHLGDLSPEDAASLTQAHGLHSEKEDKKSFSDRLL